MSSHHPALQPDILRPQVAQALAEDVGPEDITAALLPKQLKVRGRLLLREPAVLCGRPWWDEVFRQLGNSVQTRWLAEEGQHLAAGTSVCELEGPARAVLTGERTAINFLQTLSGTATRTAHWQALLAGTGCTLLDTRKTLPGLRLAQKYAVHIGGGRNHRLGLYDAFLIKENHILAAGSIAAVLQQARRRHPDRLLEIEVENLDELEQALTAGCDRVLLDNFTLGDMRKAVALRDRLAPGITLEASGNLDTDRLQAVAATGVDFISSGALTKHLQAVDFSLRLLD